ncbi:MULTISPECIES: ferredoxin--NADP reductase [Vibrio]|uniref:ferredoxin--NADP(+) reductase n=1 Tax=Vibrio algicola TaxID=2662262 RepID=A0A5Q0TJT4_9VIBR|nr:MULTISPECIES: ferredoxin--NADP reductase [Vibrio]MBD1577855.1 ferredoxin--NADP reductase [Vibrio sp. S11_S32]
MKDIPVGFTAGRVIKRIEWAQHLFSLVVEVPANAYPSPAFIAGQFSKLALVNGQGEWVRRAYSMVNNPTLKKQNLILEFLVIEIPQGQLTPLLAHLQAGNTIYVGTQPSGFMTVDEIPDSAIDLWMLSTGTGIGPFLSILEEVEQCQKFEHLVLVHAVRTKEELVYKDKIIEMMKTYQGKLRYVPIVSREVEQGALQGRIPELLKSEQLSAAAHVTLTPEHSFFYLCGNPNMVHDTRDTLESMGYQKHLRSESGQFSFENYW